MSRSRRKTPIIGNTVAESDKWFKRSEHKRERAAVRGAISHGEDPPAPKRFGNPWVSMKDGKQYLFGAVDRWMRK